MIEVLAAIATIVAAWLLLLGAGLGVYVFLMFVKRFVEDTSRNRGEKP